GNIVGRYDLDRVEGRVQALRAAAPLVASVRDQSMVSGYIRELAALIGLDIDEVRAQVLRAASRPRDSARAQAPPTPPEPESDGGPGATGPALPDPRDRDLVVEREAAKLLLQVPQSFDADFHGLTEDDFHHPAYRAVFTAARTVRAVAAPGDGWSDRVRAELPAQELQQLGVALTVEPLSTNREPDTAFVRPCAAQLRLIHLMGRITDLKSKLQRTNPVSDTARYNQMFSVLLRLESDPARLKHLAAGEARAPPPAHPAPPVLP